MTSEDHQQLPDLDAAFFACGGGGLLTGSAGWLKSHNPDIEAFGVSPENSPVMYESMRANRIVEMETHQTLADTCAGGVDSRANGLLICSETQPLPFSCETPFIHEYRPALGARGAQLTTWR